MAYFVPGKRAHFDIDNVYEMRRVFRSVPFDRRRSPETWRRADEKNDIRK